MESTYSKQASLGSSDLPQPQLVNVAQGIEQQPNNQLPLSDSLQQQRTWKIGTYSMGITLIGIGLAFAASMWQAVTSYELLLWLAPIIFIVLGSELMIAHSSRFMRKYKVAYNWLGVFFVGCVGAGALILAAFLSSGLLEEVNQIFHLKERSIYIEENTQLVDPAIKTVVVKSELGYELQQQADINELSLLGLVQYEAKEPVKLGEQQLLMTKQVGSVLYVFIRNLEYDDNLLTSSYVRSKLVLNVPEHLEVK